MSDEQTPAEPKSPAPPPPVRQTDQLAAALAAAQGEYRPLKRTKTVTVKIKPEKGGGQYSYKYAPLDECIAATRPALSKHELAVTQVFHADPSMRIVTTLLHSSGQFVVSTLPLRPHTNEKELAAEITYMRRYSYVALVNIAADEDTDGSHPPHSDEYAHAPAAAQQPPPGTTDKGKGPSKAQLKRLFAIAKEHGWATEELKGELLVRYRVEHTSDLTKAQYDELCGNARTKTKGLLETLKAAPPETPPPADEPAPKATRSAGPAGETDSSSAPEQPSGTEAEGGGDGQRYLDMGEIIEQATGNEKLLAKLAAKVDADTEWTEEQRGHLLAMCEEGKTE
jgi:hypothetical protein